MVNPSTTSTVSSPSKSPSSSVSLRIFRSSTRTWTIVPWEKPMRPPSVGALLDRASQQGS